MNRQTHFRLDIPAPLGNSEAIVRPDSLNPGLFLKWNRQLRGRIMVVRLTLDQVVEVRILAPQPSPSPAPSSSPA